MNNNNTAQTIKIRLGQYDKRLAIIKIITLIRALNNNNNIWTH
jgi:hypothetical protein